MATYRVYTKTRNGWWNPTQWMDGDATKLVERLRSQTPEAEIRREIIGGQPETIFSKPRGKNAEVKDLRPVLDAKAQVTSRVDPKDRYERTAIELRSETYPQTGISVDLLVHGQLFCRLNLSATPDKSWGNVDVILDPTTQQGRFMAWRGGEQVVSNAPEGVTAYSVDITAKGQAAPGTETDEKTAL